MVRTAFPDPRFTLDVWFAEGELVTGRWTMTGQEIFRVREHRDDIDAMLDHLGLTPPRRVMRLAARMSARRFRRGR